MRFTLFLLMAATIHAQPTIWFTSSVNSAVAATPTFSPTAGSVTGGTSVTISTTTSGATICYTTDGSDPAASTAGTCSAGSTYSGALTVSTAQTVKALATKAGYNNSSIATAAYTILFTFGVNFRSTSAYVTDPTNTTYCTLCTYPTTRGGQTFGWQSITSMSGRDRSTSLDVRLAGNNSSPTSIQSVFELDLTPGTYAIRLAIGDPSFASNGQIVLIYDDTTLLATVVNGVTVTAGSAIDAMGNTWTDANWPTSNVTRTVTLTSTSAPGGKSKLLIKTGGNTGQTALQHVGVSQ